MAETGTVQTYRHQETGRNIHIDATNGQFFNQNRNPSVLPKHSTMPSLVAKQKRMSKASCRRSAQSVPRTFSVTPRSALLPLGVIWL